MFGLLYLVAAVPLLSCGYGLVSGQIIYFSKRPDEFLGSIKTVSRSETPVGFWSLFALNLAFGLAVSYFIATEA